MPDDIRIALITDIHNGRRSLTKRGDAAPELLENFTNWVNAEGPDFVVDLGDRISDESIEADRRNMMVVSQALSKLNVPTHHILGNHDLEHLERADNEEIFGQAMTSRCIEFKGWQLVFWQSLRDMKLGQPVRASREELDWLAESLAVSDLPSIIFSHLPLDGQKMSTNFYFANNTEFAAYENEQEVQEILLQAGNVVACVAGHVHWNNVNRLGGVPFITLQSLTESCTNEGAAAGAWGELVIGEDLYFRCHGEDSFESRIPLGGHKSWSEPLPPFAELGDIRRDKKSGPVGNAKAFLLDLDGVIYRENELIPGADVFVSRLKDSGRKVMALTNNASKSAEEFVVKLARMGIELAKEEVLTSTEATVTYLQRQDGITSVFTIGPESLRSAVNEAGYTCEPKNEVDAVVVAIDDAITIAELNEAFGYLNRGARLIATNPDLTIPVPGAIAPETGAVIAFLEASSGKQAEVVGKPNRLMFDMALEKLGMHPREVVMVGDTLATDIEGARSADMRAVLITGENSSETSVNTRASLSVSSVAELIKLI